MIRGISELADKIIVIGTSCETLIEAVISKSEIIADDFHYFVKFIRFSTAKSQNINTLDWAS